MEQFSIRTALEWGIRYLKSRKIASSRLDAELILADALGADRTVVYAHPGRAVSQAERKRYESNVRKRGKRWPLAWVLGVKEFYGLDLRVVPGVFCPRPETEIMVEEIIRAFTLAKKVKMQGTKESKINAAPPRYFFYEIGSGTGAISVALAKNLPGVSITCCDINPGAVALTSSNVRNLGLSKRVKVVQGSLFDRAGGRRYHCIVSNPPYLSREDYMTAEPEVRKEPKRALMAPDRGLFLIRKIVRAAAFHLKKGGYLFIELGHGQGRAVHEYAAQLGYSGEIINDLAGQERVYKGTLDHFASSRKR